MKLFQKLKYHDSDDEIIDDIKGNEEMNENELENLTTEIILTKHRI